MSHLSISTTREGTDPPATDVVPDKNLTTLGVLGWRRRGETASGDSNSKSGGSHNGTLADIGSPSWSYYGGSNDKQAALSPYTDGTSPASSAGTRGYVSTGVNGAGVRITIPLASQSIKVGLLIGSYGGTVRVAPTLANGAASVSALDHVAGSSTVGWWHTVILAHADTTTDLQIDVTAHVGTSLQFMGFYVDYGTPVLVSISPAEPYPGQSVTATVAGYPQIPDTATYSGVSLTVGGGATLTSVPLTWPARSAFRFGGAHQATKFDALKSLVISKSAVSASKQVKTQPQQPGNYGLRDALSAAYDLGTWNSGAIVLAANDPVYGHVTAGSAAVNAPAVDFTPYEDPTTVEWTYFDDSAGLWSGLTTTTYTGPALNIARLYAAMRRSA